MQACHAEEFFISSQARNFSDDADVNSEKDINELESDFDDAFSQTYKHILSILQSCVSQNHDFASTGESSTNMMEWKIMFEKDIEHLQLDRIYEDVSRTIQCAVSSCIINFFIYFLFSEFDRPAYNICFYLYCLRESYSAIPEKKILV